MKVSYKNISNLDICIWASARVRVCVHARVLVKIRTEEPDGHFIFLFCFFLVTEKLYMQRATIYSLHTLRI